MQEKLFSIGDRVYSTKTRYDLNAHCCLIGRKMNAPYPMEKKIKQIEVDKDGEFHYGVGDYHFTNKDIGDFIFTDFDSAMNAINS